MEIASVQSLRYFGRVPGIAAKFMVSPLMLLLRVNVTNGWRRLLAVREQSRLLTSIISIFVLGYLVLSFWLRDLGK